MQRNYLFDLKARQRKMQQIARLLELPTNIVESMYQPPSSVQPAVSLRAMPGGATVSSETYFAFLISLNIAVGFPCVE